MSLTADQSKFQIYLDNAASLDEDGWALIAPFGEHPKSRIVRQNGREVPQRFLQILDNESAEALLDSENSLFGRLKRAVIGIPIYSGHPDLKDHAPETLANNQAKRQIGVVDKVRLGLKGIEAHHVLSPDGAEAVEKHGCKYPSALWLCNAAGERNGFIIVRPFKLLSVGLTAHPNIAGVEALANQTESGLIEKQESAAAEAAMADQQKKIMLHGNLIGLLVGKGVAIPNDASDSALLAALANEMSAPRPFQGNQHMDSRAVASTASARAEKSTAAAFEAGTKQAHQKAEVDHKAAAGAVKARNPFKAAYHNSMAALHSTAAKAAAK